MKIRTFTHAAQQHLKADAAASIPKTHLYELLAAAFGFDSYAALRTGGLLYVGDGTRPAALAPANLARRCRELGYASTAPAVVEQLSRLILDKHVELLDIASILQRRRDEDAEFLFGALDNAVPAQALEALREAASDGHGLAHYVLALFHESEGGGLPASGAFWHQQEQKGIVLQGVELEWAQAYRDRVAHTAARQHHLTAAAALGNALALFELATESGDTRFFDVFPVADAALGLDPRQVSQVAYALGRDAAGGRWKRLAAEGGDIDAMYDLVTVDDQDDPVACWTWVYLARLHGVDLIEDDLRAIHEDGSHYDDDVGGPLFVEGRPRVELEPLDAPRDRVARQAARAIHTPNA